jgi:hypothetical protein
VNTLKEGLGKCNAVHDWMLDAKYWFGGVSEAL